MRAVDDEVPTATPELATSHLVRYDAEKQRVADALSSYHQQAHADDTTVPTECLAEELEEAYELPSSFRAGRVAVGISSHPWQIVLSVLLLSAITTLWVGLTPGERFSTKEDLFIAKDDPAVENFYVLRHLPPNALKSPADVWPSDRRRRLLPSPSERASRQLSSQSPDLDWRQAVTLVYERRGIDNAPKVLSLRQIKAIHDLEHEIMQVGRWNCEGRSLRLPSVPFLHPLSVTQQF